METSLCFAIYNTDTPLRRCIKYMDTYAGKWSPTDPFTIVELQNPSLDVPELLKIRRSPEKRGSEIVKGPVGSSSLRTF